MTKVDSASQTMTVRIVIGALSIGMAVVFIGTGVAKLIGVAVTVKAFAAIGAGQWFRYFTGVLEIACGFGLLIPRFAVISASLLVCTMLGAVIALLGFIGDSVMPPFALLGGLAMLLWLRRGGPASVP